MIDDEILQQTIQDFQKSEKDVLLFHQFEDVDPKTGQLTEAAIEHPQICSCTFMYKPSNWTVWWVNCNNDQIDIPFELKEVYELWDRPETAFWHPHQEQESIKRFQKYHPDWKDHYLFQNPWSILSDNHCS